MPFWQIWINSWVFDRFPPFWAPQNRSEAFLAVLSDFYLLNVHSPQYPAKSLPEGLIWAHTGKSSTTDQQINRSTDQQINRSTDHPAQQIIQHQHNRSSSTTSTTSTTDQQINRSTDHPAPPAPPALPARTTNHNCTAWPQILSAPCYHSKNNIKPKNQTNPKNISKQL